MINRPFVNAIARELSKFPCAGGYKRHYFRGPNGEKRELCRRCGMPNIRRKGKGDSLRIEALDVDGNKVDVQRFGEGFTLLERK